MNSPHHILSSIGNTPLVKLNRIVSGDSADIYIKLEYFNPTSSYKDRMALAIIDGAEKRGDLKKGMTVVECTGGSTGTSLAFVCARKGYPFTAISSDAFAKEKLKAIQLFGGELQLIPSQDGKITPELMPKMLGRAEELSKEGNVFWTRQFENKDALFGYNKLGEEITKQLESPVDVFCAAVGTAGLAMGVSQALKRFNPKTRTVVLEPASAPLISKGIKGPHKVEGIATGIIPAILDKKLYDEAIAIEEDLAREVAYDLVREEGILAGTSTGLNVAAAIQIARKLGRGRTVVTVACDSGLKYLAGGLFDR